MNISQKLLALSISSALLAPSLAVADNFYLSTQIGSSIQATDSEPYGNNIAVDSDFPAEFDSGDGSVVGIGLGYIINDQFRIEGRIAKRDADFNDRKVGTGARAGEEYILNGELETTSFTVEGFYDFTNDSAFTPFVKAGIGIAKNDYSARLGGAGVAGFDAADGKVDGYYDSYEDGDSTEFTWNIGFGGNYAISESFSVYGEYQYASFGDVETGQDSFTDGFTIDGITAHEVTAGIRFVF